MHVSKHLGHAHVLEQDHNLLRNTYSKCKYGGSGTRQPRVSERPKRERESGYLYLNVRVCVSVSLFFDSRVRKWKKTSQPEPEPAQAESTSKTLVVAIARCICKYVPTTEAIQSEYVTNQCPNERPRRVRNAAWASRLINRANSGTNLKPVYLQHGKGSGSVSVVALKCSRSWCW